METATETSPQNGADTMNLKCVSSETSEAILAATNDDPITDGIAENGTATEKLSRNDADVKNLKCESSESSIATPEVLAATNKDPVTDGIEGNGTATQKLPQNEVDVKDVKCGSSEVTPEVPHALGRISIASDIVENGLVNGEAKIVENGVNKVENVEDSDDIVILEEKRELPKTKPCKVLLERIVDIPAFLENFASKSREERAAKRKAFYDKLEKEKREIIAFSRGLPQAKEDDNDIEIVAEGEDGKNEEASPVLDWKQLLNQSAKEKKNKNAAVLSTLEMELKNKRLRNKKEDEMFEKMNAIADKDLEEIPSVPDQVTEHFLFGNSEAPIEPLVESPSNVTATQSLPALPSLPQQPFVPNLPPAYNRFLRPQPLVVRPQQLVPLPPGQKISSNSASRFVLVPSGTPNRYILVNAANANSLQDKTKIIPVQQSTVSDEELRKQHGITKDLKVRLQRLKLPAATMKRLKEIRIQREGQEALRRSLNIQNQSQQILFPNPVRETPVSEFFPPPLVPEPPLPNQRVARKRKLEVARAPTVDELEHCASVTLQIPKIDPLREYLALVEQGRARHVQALLNHEYYLPPYKKAQVVVETMFEPPAPPIPVEDDDRWKFELNTFTSYECLEPEVILKTIYHKQPQLMPVVPTPLMFPTQPLPRTQSMAVRPRMMAKPVPVPRNTITNQFNQQILYNQWRLPSGPGLSPIILQPRNRGRANHFPTAVNRLPGTTQVIRNTPYTHPMNASRQPRLVTPLPIARPRQVAPRPIAPRPPFMQVPVPLPLPPSLQATVSALVQPKPPVEIVISDSDSEGDDHVVIEGVPIVQVAEEEEEEEEVVTVFDSISRPGSSASCQSEQDDPLADPLAVTPEPKNQDDDTNGSDNPMDLPESVPVPLA